LDIGTGSELHQPLAIAVIGVFNSHAFTFNSTTEFVVYFNIEQKE
jgi:Cu/Ag efflux pump CusA